MVSLEISISQSRMDTLTLMLMALTLGLVWAAFSAWQVGNERRDVLLLAAVAGVSGLGTGFSALV